MPQWEPYLFGGMPYIAAMHGDIFYLTALLRLIMPTDAAMTWGLAIHVFLAGMFTYVFLRAWGFGFFPSLLGGVAYMLSGQIVSLVSPGHDGKLFISALLPLGLWALTRGVRDGRNWAWGAYAIVVALAVLSPHPQLLQYFLLLSGAFALYLAFAPAPDGTRLERSVALRRLGFALGAVIIGALIGAMQYFPVREYVAWSPRAGGRDYDYATSFSMPLEELLNTYLPQFSGILERYWGRNGIHLHSEYIGVAVMVLAAAAFGGAERRGFRRFWIGTFVVSLLWALGGSTPFYHLVYALVPGSKFFRAPSTIFYITCFSVAVFAAMGTERVLAGRVTARYAIGWAIAGVVVALLASIGAFTSLAQMIGAGLPYEGVMERIDANAGAVVFGAWRSLLFVLLAAGLVWAAANRRLSATAIGWALVAVVAVDLYSVEKQYWIFSPPASKTFASDPAIEAIKRGEPGRVLALPMSNDFVFHDPNLFGDGLMVHGIRSLTGYHGNELGRYQQLLGYEAGGAPDTRRLLNPQIWRDENVRYLYTNVDKPLLDTIFATGGLPGPTKLAGPVKDAAGGTVYAYRLPGDNPPAWVAPVIVKAPDDRTLGTVVDPRFDPTRAAIFDTAANVPAQAITALPPALPVKATVDSYEPGHIALTLDGDVPAGSALVVSENYFPGWTAQVDGKPATTARVNFNLIGVPLPAGAKHAELHFADPAYEKGKTVSIVAAVVALLLLGWGIVTDRRRPAAAPAAA